MTVRIWAHRYLPAAFLIGACFVVPGGGVVFSIATGLATQVVSPSTDQAIGWVRRRITGQRDDDINHDLQRAMERGYVRAIEHLHELWNKSFQADAKLGGDGDAADVFEWLIDDAHLLLQDDRLNSFLGSAEAIQGFGGRAQLDQFLEPYLRGRSSEIGRFISSALVPEIATFFGEELKADTRAWRAFQRLVTDSMLAGFNRIEATQQRQQAETLVQLEAIAERLEREPVTVVVDVGREGLDQAIAESREAAVRAIEADGRLTREMIELTFDLLSHQADVHHTEQISHLTNIEQALERLAQRLEIAPVLVSDERIVDLSGRQRNDHFVGREPAFRMLDRVFARGGDGTPHLAVLHGNGGVGKTQTALEYAWRSEHRYDGVWWLLSESESSIITRFSELATRLKLPASESGDPQLAADEAREYLAHRSPGHRWLLIFDNAADVETVSRWIPERGAIDAIITSRIAIWDGDRDFSAIPLDVWSAESARAFLLQRTGEADAESADALASELGYLPLALEQAAAYIRAMPQRRSLATYLALFRSDPGKALREHRPKTGNYPDTVATTWSISLAAAAAEEPAADDLMALLSLFAPEAIPLNQIIENANLLPERLSAALNDPDLSVVEVLDRYSLIALGPTGDIVIHRLVQAVTRERLDDAQMNLWVDRAMVLIEQMFPDDAAFYAGWAAAAALLPHADRILEHSRRHDRFSVARSDLLSKVGVYCLSQNDLDRARELTEESLSVRRIVDPDAESEIAMTVHNLGFVYESQGAFAHAQSLYEEALALKLRVFAADDPEIARTINNLGLVLYHQGDYDAAATRFDEALARLSISNPGDHEDIALVTHNLAIIKRKRGDLAAARPLCEQSLALWRQLRPANDPDIAISMTNLASVMQAEGDLVGARTLFEEALELRQRALPPDHTDIAFSLNYVANLFAAEGDPHSALALHEQAAAIYQRALPADHPDIAFGLNHLAVALETSGDLNRARSLCEEALAINLKSLPEDHPDTLKSRGDLARITAALEAQAGN